MNPKNVAETIKSTTTYSESSTVVPVYTSYGEGSNGFKKVIADLDYYNTKPEKTEVTRSVRSNYFGVSHQTTQTYSLINDKDAESLYYHAKGPELLGLTEYLVNYLSVEPISDSGTLILYNKETKTYTSKPVKGMKLTRKSSKSEVEGHYTKEYSGYYGAPKPVYSYSPTVELIAYKDGTYEWKYSDNWKLENEDELKAYISSSPKKED